MRTICGLCGKHASGHATINNTRYCHGDNDIEPTCYQRATRDQLLTDVAWDAITGGGNNLMEMR